MKAATVALLGHPLRAQALRQQLQHLPLHWVEQPTPTSLNLLLDPDDGAWRQRLISAALPFQVARDDTQVLRAVGAALGVELVDTDAVLLSGRGRWSCESCSDPECEHRLFSALLAQRRGAGG